MIYLCDIDGTVADCTHRLKYISENGKKCWSEFFEACDEDAPILPVIKTIQLLKQAGATIILMSGRSEVVRQKTLDWCAKWGVPHDDLYMRRDKDHRPDNIVKAELLDMVGMHWNLNQLIAVFDDRQQVVDMYRSRGIKVFQCAKGDF
jgi:hypothetical protein